MLGAGNFDGGSRYASMSGNPSDNLPAYKRNKGPKFSRLISDWPKLLSSEWPDNSLYESLKMIGIWPSVEYKKRGFADRYTNQFQRALNGWAKKFLESDVNIPVNKLIKLD